MLMPSKNRSSRKFLRNFRGPKIVDFVGFLKVLNRLHFINYLHDECSVPEAVETKVSYGRRKIKDFSGPRNCKFRTALLILKDYGHSLNPLQRETRPNLKANIFGFYAIKCNNVVDFKENSKKEAVAEFLHQSNIGSTKLI